MSAWKFLATTTVALGALLLSAPIANGFDVFESGCSGCHPDFGGFGETTHDLHLQMTTTCTYCHSTPAGGNNPSISKCNGCHNGLGTRAHHRNAGTSTCGNTSCHSGDATPPPEDTVPPYYGMPDVNIDHPCFVDPLGAIAGEDFDGDGEGIDNDGDLAYEADDPDCDDVPNVPSTWGRIKSLF
jgi:predicted CxxxxCH...CXXCH cytochrome family protein